MSEYLVQPTKLFNVYNVHKLIDGGDIPETTYTVKWDGRKPKCNCPSGVFRGYCKHVDYVRKYRKQVALGQQDLMIAFCDD